VTNNPPQRSNELSGYQNLLSNGEWSNLHPAIQRRFSTQLHDSVTYQGEMKEIYLSFAGIILAHCCRLIGTPLALYSEINVPMVVKVYPNKKLAGMTWDRFYQYKNAPLNRVRSTKCVLEKNGLVEMVGFGFGMQLDVIEKNGAIIFESKKFFWKSGRIQINIPSWLSPGKTIVSQRALDNDRFEFRLDVTHPVLGKLFKQIGVFVPRATS